MQDALDDSELYQSGEKEVDAALNELKKVGLSREQKKVVDKAISATNASGAAYGETAYRRGLYDGIKLMSEINQISQTEDLLSKQDIDCDKVI